MKKANVIILAGQSNAVGVGYVKYLSDHFSKEKVNEYSAGYPDILINYYSHDKRSEGFVPTTLNCSEVSKDTFGPEVGMAEILHGLNDGNEYFIIKCAFGGTTLYNDWLSPSGGPEYDSFAYADQVENVIAALNNGVPLRAGWAYNEFIRLMNDSLVKLNEKGYEPKILGFCWMQGESDALDRKAAEGYADRYDALICDISSAFGEYMSDCIFVDGGISELWEYYHAVNEAKADYAASHENSVYIDTIAAGLTTLNEPKGSADAAHYDSNCVIKLGKLFIEAIGIH